MDPATRSLRSGGLGSSSSYVFFAAGTAKQEGCPLRSRRTWTKTAA